MSAQDSLALEVGTALIPADIHKEIQAALEYCRSVVEITIEDDEQNNSASLMLKQIGETVKTLEKRRKELKAPWADKASAVDKEFRIPSEALSNLDRRIRQAMSSYYAKQQAERERLAREAEAKAAEERRKAELKAQAERQKADAYREQGRTEMAERAEARADEALDKAAATVAPVVQAPKILGASMLDHWTVKVVDKNAAVAACMANSLLVAAVVIDTKFLETLEDSKAIKGNLKINGCEITYTPQPRRK